MTNLKIEIADYLNEYHGGRDTDLDANEAAEHIFTKLAEPHLRAMIAQEIIDGIPQMVPYTNYQEGKVDGLNLAARIAEGPQQ